MTKFFLDTEFNGFEGELISLALVPEFDHLPNLYMVLELPEEIVPWVEENVIPKLGSVTPTERSVAAERLGGYLNSFGGDEIVIVADWLEDFTQFNNLLITGPGTMIRIKSDISFILKQDDAYDQSVLSATPHNALSDALALRKFYVG